MTAPFPTCTRCRLLTTDEPDGVCRICKREQPKPIPNGSKPIADMVVADLMERKRIGTERYGTPLQAHNGRDALRDLYEELLDAVQYLRQAIEERDTRRDPPV